MAASQATGHKECFYVRRLIGAKLGTPLHKSRRN